MNWLNCLVAWKRAFLCMVILNTELQHVSPCSIKLESVAFITHSSQLHSFSCVHTFEQDVWCWWPWPNRYRLPVIWVIKGCMTKWLRFLTFFLKIQKKHDFLRFFLRCCTRFLEHWLECFVFLSFEIDSFFIGLLWVNFVISAAPAATSSSRSAYDSNIGLNAVNRWRQRPCWKTRYL